MKSASGQQVWTSFDPEGLKSNIVEETVDEAIDRASAAINPFLESLGKAAVVEGVTMMAVAELNKDPVAPKGYVSKVPAEGRGQYQLIPGVALVNPTDQDHLDLAKALGTQDPDEKIRLVRELHARNYGRNSDSGATPGGKTQKDTTDESKFAQINDIHLDEPDQSSPPSSNAWKDKIYGTAQKTGTPGHQFRTYREAIALAKDPDVATVSLDKGYNFALDLDPGTINSNRRPDVTAVYHNGDVARIEVQSKTDIPQELRNRNTALDPQIRKQQAYPGGPNFNPLPPDVVAPH